MQQRASRPAPSLEVSDAELQQYRMSKMAAPVSAAASGATTSPDTAQQLEAQTITLPKRKPPTKEALLKNALGKSIGQFTRHFRQWDTSGDGTIDVHEFSAALRSLKLPGADDEDTCALLFKEIDFDGSGTLSNYECLRYAVLDVIQRDLDRIYTLCLLWDHDRSKTLNKDEVSRKCIPLPLSMMSVASLCVSLTFLTHDL